MFLLSSDYWEVRNTPGKGQGVFANQDIDPGVILGDYIGTVLKTSEADTKEKDDQLYLMYYHDNASLFPDLQKPGIHLLNHSCEANCWMYTYYGHTLFFTLRHIFKGEELTISYLISPKDEYCNPCTHICTCGSTFCTGTFHMSEEQFEKWNEFHYKETIRTKRKRIAYNKPLPLLPSYPKQIPDNPIYNIFGAEAQTPETIHTQSIPSIKSIRQLIRKTGRTLLIPELKTQIYGVVEGKIITGK